MNAADAIALTLEQLERDGLLLMQDARLPSLVTLVAGEPVRGSWWSHPRGKLMYEVLQVVSEKALVVKLIAGKRTFVHARLWPCICALAESGEPWQLAGLRPDALELLRRVRASKALRSDRLDPLPGPRLVGAVTTDLEKRLLVHATDEHTESGHHARVLETWASFRKRAKLSAKSLPTATDARAQLAVVAQAWAGDEPVAFPWL